MDRLTRSLSRGGLDSPEASLQGLSARLRAGEAARLSGQRLVGGPLLSELLRYLLESSGQREVEVLRRAAVAERHHGRWIQALRDLSLARAPRSFVWVERWAELFGFDLALLALAAEPRDDPPAFRGG